MTCDGVIIHAPNVHQGGGKTLLLALLRALDADACGHVLLDRRLEVPVGLPVGIKMRRFAPSFAERLRAEVHLARVAQTTSRVLCFGSLPPLLRCRGRVAVFVQNRNIVGGVDISGYPLRQRLRIGVQRRWFRRYSRNAQTFIVQTQTMHGLVEHLLGCQTDIRVAPLVPTELLGSFAARDTEPPVAGKMYDFCYVSSGEPHKNHRMLVEAWKLLACEQWFPSLCLTVAAESFPQLHRWIAEESRCHGLNIDNVGYVSSERVAEIYMRSRALVYPAMYESFGLPLVEARRHGLRIVAAERDYVRDVVAPDECFDPLSARSIARAVERLCRNENARTALVGGPAFMSGLLAA